MKTKMGTEKEMDEDRETKGIWAGKDEEGSLEQKRNRFKFLRWRERVRDMRHVNERETEDSRDESNQINSAYENL